MGVKNNPNLAAKRLGAYYRPVRVVLGDDRVEAGRARQDALFSSNDWKYVAPGPATYIAFTA